MEKQKPRRFKGMLFKPLKKSPFLQKYAPIDIPTPPKPQKAPNEPMFKCDKRNTSTKYVNLKNPSKSRVARASSFFKEFEESNKNETQKYHPSVIGSSLERLQPEQWLNDELLTFCSKNLYSLFCGEHSQFSTLCFPHFFVAKLYNDGHAKLDGKMDIQECANIVYRYTTMLDLSVFDNIVIFNNPGRMHWNIIVIFPQLKRIELMDSLHATPGCIDKLEGIWKFLYAYGKQSGYQIVDETWKLLHSRPCNPSQRDGWNCGVYSIMSMVAVHHRVDPSKITSDVCRKFRIHLLCVLLNYNQSGLQRLVPSWESQLPLKLPKYDEKVTSMPLFKVLPDSVTSNEAYMVSVAESLPELEALLGKMAISEKQQVKPKAAAVASLPPQKSPQQEIMAMLGQLRHGDLNEEVYTRINDMDLEPKTKARLLTGVKENPKNMDVLVQMFVESLHASNLDLSGMQEKKPPSKNKKRIQIRMTPKPSEPEAPSQESMKEADENPTSEETTGGKDNGDGGGEEDQDMGDQRENQGDAEGNHNGKDSNDKDPNDNQEQGKDDEKENGKEDDEEDEGKMKKKKLNKNRMRAKMMKRMREQMKKKMKKQNRNRMRKKMV